MVLRAPKIAVVSPLGYTGLAYYDFSLCQSLAKEGADIELFTSDRWLLCEMHNEFGIVKIFEDCSGDISKLLKGLNYIRSVLSAFFLILKNDVKVIHYQIVEVPLVDLLLMVALKVLGKKVVYTPHDIEFAKNGYVNRRLQMLIYSVSDAIIVHKYVNKKKIENSVKSSVGKISVIPHGGYEYFVSDKINQGISRESLGLVTNDTLLLFFGVLKEEKGLLLLVDSIKQLKERSVDGFRVVIAGKPSHGLTEECIRSIISDYSISDLIDFRSGFVDDADVQKYYASADYVLLPYLNISESGVLLYSMTVGTPSICSNLEEFNETIIDNETGFLFDINDPCGLANKIQELLLLDTSEVEKNLIALVKEKYDWGAIAKKTLQLYKTVGEA